MKELIVLINNNEEKTEKKNE